MNSLFCKIERRFIVFHFSMWRKIFKTINDCKMLISIDFLVLTKINKLLREKNETQRERERGAREKEEKEEKTLH